MSVLLQVIQFLFIVSGLAFLGIALYQKISKRIIIRWSGWIALALFFLSSQINIVTEPKIQPSSVGYSTTTTLPNAKQQSLIIAEKKAMVVAQRDEVKKWKNELKVEIKDIDRNTSFVKRMFNNIEDYDGYKVYENLKTTANNLRICGQNISAISEIEFEDSEDNKMKETIVSDISFGCEEYATAYEDIADNLQEYNYKKISSASQLVDFHISNATDSMSKAMLRLAVLLLKYNIKY